MGVMDRLVLSDAQWDRISGLIIGRRALFIPGHWICGAIHIGHSTGTISVALLQKISAALLVGPTNNAVPTCHGNVDDGLEFCLVRRVTRADGHTAVNDLNKSCELNNVG